MSDSPAFALLQVRHVTGFNYDGTADSSYNEARMTPVASAHQEVVDASLRVTPGAVQSTYRDYFGTIVTTFDLQEPHDRLEVVALATIKTFAVPQDIATLTRTELHAAPIRDEFAEYLAPTARTMIDESVLQELHDMGIVGEDVVSTARAIVDWVRTRVAYVRGATLVSSTAQEVWDEQKGVCQDLTHVTISLLRGIGIPSRYVSGYLHSKPDAQLGETIVGESHAWVEFFCGTWIGIDPTNAESIGVHHVIVAKGREYGDVPPLKGIYRGGPSSALGVVVEVTRVA
jgi:transglutaminase-like putative cysteine protease